MAREDTEYAIIAYKSILAQIIDNRPSGTRQRLATALKWQTRTMVARWRAGSGVA
ncbi:hypothetical protein [Rhizobium leguminosarum]|uniref:hypothetical protein n=1 Tax=Rhizobium leguminosarum TaxID=384 RepID=UPI003F97CF20